LIFPRVIGGDPGAPVEFAATSSTDSGDYPRNGLIAKSEQGIADEITLVSRSDVGFGPEIGVQQRSDGPIPLEIAAKEAADELVPTEWQGQTRVSLDGNIPIEAAGSIAEDSESTDLEIGLLARSDTADGIEVALAARSDMLVRNEQPGTQSGNQGDPVEIAATSLNDASGPADPQSPASDVDSVEFACKLLILPLFWRDGSFHPRGAGGREWPIGWISRSTLNWKPGWSPGMRGFPD
jgi:hypothetical protein